MYGSRQTLLKLCQSGALIVRLAWAVSMLPPERLPSYHAIPPTAGAGTHKVENTGSTARDHLANERTFLAWLRTAISLLSLALAIAKFSPDRAGLGFAFMFACLGSALLLYSGRRYFEVMRALEQGSFRINTGDVSLLLAFLGLVAFAIVLVIVLQVCGQRALR